MEELENVTQFMILIIPHVRFASARSTSGGKESNMRKTRQAEFNFLWLGWNSTELEDQKEDPNLIHLNSHYMQALPCPKCGFETEETKSLSMSTRTHKVNNSILQPL